jgi:hypothetical protein
MPSSKYHREQAQVLAGLALSTNDATEADRFTLAAMEHLERMLPTAFPLARPNLAPINTRIAIR